MSVTTKIKSKNEAAKIEREKAAQRVLFHFGLCLPESRVLCFLDDEDPSSLKHAFGAANRGLSGTINDGADLSAWPDYVRKCVFVDHNIYPYTRRAIDQRDARIVAKRVARDLHGEQAVRRYIDKRSAEAAEPHDIVDWRFVRELTPSSSVDIVVASCSIPEQSGTFR